MTVGELEWELRRQLILHIDAIQPRVGSEQESVAYRRLTGLAEACPAFFLILAEPWLVEPAPESVRTILLDCAIVHLCLRVVDDAIDENEFIYRKNLLRLQPLYWKVFLRMGAGSPFMQVEITKLVEETVAAVERDDRVASPLDWGAKNHHLLLVPLLLSQNSLAYQQAKPALSLMIALTQAYEECCQDKLTTNNLGAVLELVQMALLPDNLHRLHMCGWPTAARQIAHDANRVLAYLEKQFARRTYETPFL